MVKIDELKKVPKIGTWYLVPCIIERTKVRELKWKYKSYQDFKEIYEEDPPLDFSIIRRIYITRDIWYIWPVINHPHNDIENGQKEFLYHVDYRFIKPYRNNRDKFGATPRVVLKNDRTFEYHPLELISLHQKVITPTRLIAKSKLKHNCIHKGKCPHRGYNLSQEVSHEGVITCPLHGLKFDSKTKQLIR